MNSFEKFNQVAEKLTSEIIEGITSENLTWEKVWNPQNAPKNYFSNRHYLGFNALYLSFITQIRKYSHPYFLSFNQAKNLGGNVKKGEKGTMIVFWKISKFVKGSTTNEAGDNEDVYGKKFTPFIWTVFNVDQIEGIDFQFESTTRIFEPIEACQKVIEGYKDCPKITHDEESAFYSPYRDLINMPPQNTFKSDESYYSVLFHEAIHSTGHTSRLKRFENLKISAFGSVEYSKEELIAEIGASFLNAWTGIKDDNFKNSLAYLKGWIKPLQDDPKMIIYAANKAHQAARYILNINEEGEN